MHTHKRMKSTKAFFDTKLFSIFYPYRIFCVRVVIVKHNYLYRLIKTARNSLGDNCGIYFYRLHRQLFKLELSHQFMFSSSNEDDKMLSNRYFGTNKMDENLKIIDTEPFIFPISKFHFVWTHQYLLKSV